MPLYDETENILDLYMYLTGETQTPKEWHKWCCISMIAAALGDRVWFEKLKFKPLYPNLYIMLVGDSGVGKSIAIDFSMQFKHPNMNMLYGAATKQAIVDRMTTPAEDGAVANSKLYIVQEELADAVGHESTARAYIKAMTAWFNASIGEIEENTRMHGRKVVEDTVCINWLAGSTVEWLTDAMDYKSMMSGAFGRVCTIPGKYNYDLRIYDTMPVRDYDLVATYIRDRVEELATCLSGPFEMMPAAREIDEEWFMNRPAPEEEAMAPFWMREPVLIWKLAMIMSACDSLDRIIRVPHILAARDLLESVKKHMRFIQIRAAYGGAAPTIEKIKEKILASQVGVTRADLTRFIARWGHKVKELDAMIDTLKEQDYIEEGRRMRKIAYFAKKKPPILWDELSD